MLKYSLTEAMISWACCGGISVWGRVSLQEARWGSDSCNGYLGIRWAWTWGTLLPRIAIFTLAQPVTDFIALVAFWTSSINWCIRSAGTSSKASKCCLRAKILRPGNRESLYRTRSLTYRVVIGLESLKSQTEQALSYRGTFVSSLCFIFKSYSLFATQYFGSKLGSHDCHNLITWGGEDGGEGAEVAE